MRPLCEKCRLGEHWACTEGGCTCEDQDCAPFHPYTTNTIGPDGRVTWNTEKENDMTPNCEACDRSLHADCHQRGANIVICGCDCDVATVGRRMVRVDPDYVASPAEVRQIVGDAVEAAGLEAFNPGDTIEVPRKVLEALTTRVKECEKEMTTPLILTKASVAENGDPFYLRAKKALDEIVTFARVDVDHEADITTTSSDGGKDLARYRSGVTEVTITVRGYTR